MLRGQVHAIAWLLTRGSVTVAYPGEGQVRCGTGQWLFHKGAQGQQTFAAGTEIISIRFDVQHPHGLPLFERKETVVVEEKAAPELKKIALELIGILDVYRNGRDRYVPKGEIPPLDFFRVESANCAWIAAYIDIMISHGQPMTSGSIEDPRVKKAMDLLNRIDTSQKQVESDVARACGLSMNRLNGLFRQELGQTIGGYYGQRRLRLARIALLDTRKQIKEIAFELGFSTAAHFSNWFTTRQHCSPNEYRRQLPDVTAKTPPPA